MQHRKHGQAIFARPCEECRVVRIANDVRVPELARDPRRCVVGLLIRRRRQAGGEQVVNFAGERLGRVRQDVRQAARGNSYVEVLQELADLRLAHVAAILQRQDQGPQVGAEIARVVATGQRPTKNFFSAAE